MLLPFLQRYTLKLTFALTLLLGLQLPNFLQQYEHRLDAHFLESQAQLQQYQYLAELYFGGDLQGLINKHQHSEVAVFNDEAVIIENLVARFTLLQAKKQALQGTLAARLLFLLGEFNSPLFLETQQNYNAEIVLNKDAIVTGLIVALIASLLVECLLLLLTYQGKRLCGYLNNKKMPAKKP